MRSVMMGVILVITGGALSAQEVLTGKEAKRLMFGTRGVEGVVDVATGLSTSDQDILERVAITQKYYGVIAFSPDEGLLSQATVAAANYHDVAPARRDALAECNSKRATGTAECIVGAEILPRKYVPGRGVQLNMDATLALSKEYRRLRGEKAFAVSHDTGHWGFGKGDAIALERCSAEGAMDCAIVVRD